MTTPSNANTSGLEACPFCGGTPFDRGFRRWECGSCGAQGPAGSKADATSGWNRRVTAASAQAAIDAEREQFGRMLVEAANARDAAEARADRLAKALEPFATYPLATLRDGTVAPDEYQLTGRRDEEGVFCTVTNADFQRARAALQQEG